MRKTFVYAYRFWMLLVSAPVISAQMTDSISIQAVLPTDYEELTEGDFGHIVSIC